MNSGRLHCGTSEQSWFKENSLDEFCHLVKHFTAKAHGHRLPDSEMGFAEIDGAGKRPPARVPAAPSSSSELGAPASEMLSTWSVNAVLTPEHTRAPRNCLVVPGTFHPSSSPEKESPGCVGCVRYHSLSPHLQGDHLQRGGGGWWLGSAAAWHRVSVQTSRGRQLLRQQSLVWAHLKKGHLSGP